VIGWLSGRCAVPESKKKTTTKKKRPRSSRESWSEGERRLARMAEEAGVKPIRDIADLAYGTPEDADELLSAIREMRALERQALVEKQKRKKAPKRA
jgi:hypothetical protein